MNMPTDKPRITFAVDESLLQQVEDFKDDNNCKNLSQAILALLNKGLDIEESAADAHAPSDEALAIAADFDDLTEEGKRLVTGFMILVKQVHSKS
jgi:rRNA maturation endonuclease Nob1